MKLIIHPTAHPQVFFAGGDVFSKDSYNRFDGLLICAGGFNGLTAMTRDAVRKSTIPIPHQIHAGGEYVPKKGIPALIHHDLDVLSGQGCKRIGVHTHHDLSRAKAAVRAVVSWLEKHPGAIETVTFVDMRDDYYNCFGLDSFVKGYKAPVNVEPTGFEFYFEQVFRNDLSEQFPLVKSGKCKNYCTVVKKPVVVEDARVVDFSVALFYTALVPQAIAKVTGDIQYMYAFSRRADWPLLDRLMAGWMAPYVYLEDTGLMPKDEQVSEWVEQAEAEYSYFCRVLTHYVLNGIQVERSADAKLLAQINTDTIKKIHREMRAQLKALVDYFHGGPMLPNYYLSDKIREQVA